MTEKEIPPPILLDLPNELVGPRVLLRPFRPGDGTALWEAVEESRAHITPWMAWVEHNQSAADSEMYARQASARWVTRESLAMGIWDRGTRRYLGQCGLVRPDWAVPSFEVGYWVRASAQGFGYVTEAVGLATALAFETLGAQRVHIQCDSLNLRSAAVAQRLGFPLEGTLRRNERSTSGELRDTLIFALTPDDYVRARAEWEQAQ